MYKNRKVIVVMPAYNAEETLQKTYDEVMAQDYVDQIILVDDASRDHTVDIAAHLPSVLVYKHERNMGYGASQKLCYRLALEKGADIVVMVHPDYQYTPLLLPAMISLIGNGLYHCVIGSRILGGQTIRQGMPLWRYMANRFLTLVENFLLRAKLSEYHSGYRAFSKELLSRLPLEKNSDDFVFDNQMLAQTLWFGYAVGEVSCPTRYCEEASSINFFRSVVYGIGCLVTAVSFRLARRGWIRSAIFPAGDGSGILL